MNAVGESPEGTKSQAWNQSGTDGEACRSIPTDHQPLLHYEMYKVALTKACANTGI